jgi:hypothetical protein
LAVATFENVYGLARVVGQIGGGNKGLVVISLGVKCGVVT